MELFSQRFWAKRAGVRSCSKAPTICVNSYVALEPQRPSWLSDSSRLDLRTLICILLGPGINSSHHRQNKFTNHLLALHSHPSPFSDFVLTFWMYYKPCWSKSMLYLVFWKGNSLIVQPFYLWTAFNNILTERPGHDLNHSSPVFNFHFLLIKCLVNSQRS